MNILQDTSMRVVEIAVKRKRDQSRCQRGERSKSRGVGSVRCDVIEAQVGRIETWTE